MKTIFITFLATVLLQDLAQMVQAACIVELDDSNVKDLIDRVLHKKTTDEVSVRHQRREMIAFSASMNKSQSLSSGTVIIFNKVWTNIGNGYNENTGIFTAPVGGVYQFTSTVMPTNSKGLFVRLYHNNSKTTALYFKAVSAHYNANTLNIILQIKKGDTISMKSGHSGKTVYSDDDNYNSFSGYLI